MLLWILTAWFYFNEAGKHCDAPLAMRELHVAYSLTSLMLSNLKVGKGLFFWCFWLWNPAVCLLRDERCLHSKCKNCSLPFLARHASGSVFILGVQYCFHPTSVFQHEHSETFKLSTVLYAAPLLDVQQCKYWNETAVKCVIPYHALKFTACMTWNLHFNISFS